MDDQPVLGTLAQSCDMDEWGRGAACRVILVSSNPARIGLNVSVSCSAW